MSQNESRGLAIGALTISVLSLAASVTALACSPEGEPRSEPVSRVILGTPAPAASAPSAAPPKAAAPAPVKEDKPLVAPKSKQPVEAVTSAKLVVKRFVVTSGVHQREPLASDASLVSDGKAIYAFAELGNPAASEQEVSVLFERKGSDQRVGYATLQVPAGVPRHRTWANTRYIREPGTWDAVLTANGVELARTSFEVAAR